MLKDNLNNQVSAYGAINYSYKNLYILNANMRVDYSNKFGDRSREKFLPIWSVSGPLECETGYNGRCVLGE